MRRPWSSTPLKSYLADPKRKLKLPSSHPALLLFDNFKGQYKDTSKINIDVVLIPTNCTDRLQPLDLSVNKTAKESLHKCFQNVMPFKFGKTSKELVGLRLTVMKPLRAKWLVEFYDYMKGKPAIILRTASKKQESKIVLHNSGVFTIVPNNYCNEST